MEFSGLTPQIIITLLALVTVNFLFGEEAETPRQQSEKRSPEPKTVPWKQSTVEGTE
jgi:hypothetical protein